MMEAVFREVRFALRTLRRDAPFAAVALVTFAIGVGMNAAMFSVLDRVLFRPLPYRAPGDLVLLRQCAAGGECSGTMPSAVAYAAQALKSFDGFAAAGFSSAFAASREAGETLPLRLIHVSPRLLGVLGVAPIRGRDFRDDDARAKRGVALLSYQSWQARFGGADDVIGRDLWARGSPTTIVGVLPPDFIPPAANAHDPAWDGLVLGTAFVEFAPEGRIMPPVARLHEGVSLERARLDVDALVGRLQAAGIVEQQTGTSIRVDPLQTTLFARWRANFWAISGTTAILLLLACANIATLMLAHARAREHDAAVVLALGATRARVLGQAFVMSLAICLGGSLIAVAAVAATSAGLAAVLPPLLARYTTAATDPRVLLAALVVAAACGIAAGLLPALRGTRVDLLRVLQRSPRSARPRLRGGATLLAIEAALGVMLVTSGALMLQSFVRLSNDDLGYDPRGLYAVSIGVRGGSPAARLAAYEQALDVLRGIPGVAAVGGADSPVGAGAAPMRGFAPGSDLPGGRFEITAGYFDALGTTLVAGRPFTDAEVRSRASVAILNRAAARALWPDVAPLDVVGRMLRAGGEERRIVGVAPDLKAQYGQSELLPALYVPLGTEPALYNAAVIRVAGAIPPDTALLRQYIGERIGAVAVSTAPVSLQLDAGLDDPRFRALLFNVLAVAALLLAATGLYAVAAFDVRHRQYEIGVRMSIGATAGHIRRTVIRGTCLPVTIGLVAGFLGLGWTTRLIERFLYQSDPRDPGLYAIVALILLVTALAAAAIPAWRAGRLDPARVLRAQ